jgi:hypothetical protein
MFRAVAIVLALAVPTTLSGCAAALIPAVAAGVMTKNKIAKPKRKEAAEASAPQQDAIAAIENTLPPVATGADPFIRFALEQVDRRGAGAPVSSALLVKKVDLLKPRFLPCDGLPLAVMIDIDDPQAPGDIAVPDMSAGLAKLREAGVQILWLSGRRASARGQLVDALQSKGFSPDGQDALMLSRGRGDRKQLERLDAAAGRCVIAILGDQRSDFDELFDYLRSDDHAITLEGMWDKGWFIQKPPPTADQMTQTGKETNALDPR